MTRAFVCTRCETPVIGVPFGRRVFDEWCQPCWWASEESLAEGAFPELDCAAINKALAAADLDSVSTRSELAARLKELEADIETARHEVSAAQDALYEAEEDLEGLERARRLIEDAQDKAQQRKGVGRLVAA